VLLVVALARVTALWGNRPGSAALILVVLMGLQTLAFAQPGPAGRIGAHRRWRKVLSARALGFAAVSLAALASYAFQRHFILGAAPFDGSLLWLLLPLCVSILIDAASSRPYVDDHWTLGRTLAACRWRLTPTEKRDYGSALIKAFFYPLMFVYIEQYLGLLDQHWLPGNWNPPALYGALMNYCFLIDLVFSAAGYALSLQILGNRVRSINPYAVGWLATLICYSPFWDMLRWIIVFRWQADWVVWTDDWPFVQALWFAMIACCLVVYAWATVELGPRFSNQTYRGTVTTGPYRLMKHPAYVAKVLSFWLITVPFVPLQGWGFALQQSLTLLLFSSIYYVRAVYEEKHLSHYPEYRAYAAGSWPA
jgi:protein-S-isoprenylcysteine O-methyltransferase Ste14